MAKLRMTFDIDTGELFDRLHAMQGDTNAIGARIVGAMLTGDTSFGDAVGMAVYGVTVHHTELLKEQPAGSPK